MSLQTGYIEPNSQVFDIDEIKGITNFIWYLE